jgi:hypothetical protein
MSNGLRSQEKVFLGTLRQRRRYQAFRIASEHEQNDDGGDPDKSDQEGQEVRRGSIRMAHVNDRSLCLGITP